MTRPSEPREPTVWSRQPPRLLLAEALGDALLTGFVSAQFPAAAAQLPYDMAYTCSGYGQ